MLVRNSRRRIAAFDAVPGLVHGFDPGGHPIPASRDEERTRLAARLLPHGRLNLLAQVHGAVVQDAPWEGRPQGDASFAARPGELLGIESADCQPVFIVDVRAGRVAAAHAGWRGTVARVAAAALSRLVAAGSDPRDLIAGLGPAIGACCYEVGDEVVAAFGAGSERFFSPGKGERPHLDVRAANVAQLVAGGIAAERIHHILDCTRCGAGFPSYRRDGGSAGRILSYAGFARQA